MLREVKLTLKRAMDICKSSEVTRKEVQTMHKGPVESTKVMYEVNSKSRIKHKPKPASAMYQYTKPESMKCGRCRRQYPPQICPAWGKSCLKCGGRNHFAEMCRTKSVKELVQGYERDDDQFFLDTHLIGNIEKHGEWLAAFRCNETRVKVKLDTGAVTNVMPLGTFREIPPRPQIKSSNTAQSTWSSTGDIYREVSARVFSEWPQQGIWDIHSQHGITTDLRTLNVWKPWIDHQRRERRRRRYNRNYQQYIQRCV